MAVTNFQSVISTQSLGTADVDKLAQSFDKLSGAIDGAGKKSSTINQHPGFADFAAKVKAGIENPLGAIGSAAEGALKTLGPFGVGIGVAAVALGALVKVGLDAGRELGALGDRIGDIAVRTGLTVKEVGEFSLAMKLAGGDISSIEGLMRKLSQGLAAGGEEGRAASEGLRDLGIKTRDLQGNIRPSSDILVQLSERLSAIKDPAQQMALAVKALGRGAVEALPDLLELSEKLKRAKELGLAPSEEDVKRWSGYQQQIAEVDAAWDQLVRKLKEPLVATISFLLKRGNESNIGGMGAGSELSLLGIEGTSTVEDFNRQLGIGANAVQGPNYYESRSAHTAQLGAAKSLDEFLNNNANLENANRQLAQLKTKLDAARSAAQQMAESKTIDPKVYDETRQKIELAEASYKRQSDLVKLLTKDEEKRLAILEKQHELLLKGEQFLTIGTGATAVVVTQDEIEKRNSAAIDLGRLRSIPRSGMTPGELQALREAELKPLEAGLQNAGSAGAFFVSPSSQRVGPAVIDNEHQLTPEEIGQRLKLAVDSARQISALEAEGIRSEAEFAARLVELRAGPGGELEAARQVADIRLRALEEEVARTGDLDRLRIEGLQIQLELEGRIAELQKRRLDEVRNLGANFFDAALGGGKGLQQFSKSILLDQGRKLAGNAAVELFGGASANIGLSGKIFQGTMLGKDPLKDVKNPVVMATDANSTATDKNTTAIDKLTAALSAARSGAVSPSGAGGAFTPSFSTFANIVKQVKAGEQIGLGTADAYGMVRNSSGLVLRGPAGGSGGAFPISDQELTAIKDSYGMSSSAQAAMNVGGGKFTAAKGIGMAGAVAGGAFGAYSGFKEGGAHGALAGVSSILGAASMIPGPQQPFVMAAALGLSALSSLGVIRDPKAERKKEIDEFLESHKYQGPDPVSLVRDTYGRDISYDQRGNLRPVQHVTNNYHSMTNHINAMDGQDVARVLEKYPAALNRGVAKAIDDGGELVPKMASALGLQ